MKRAGKKTFLRDFQTLCIKDISSQIRSERRLMCTLLLYFRKQPRLVSPTRTFRWGIKIENQFSTTTASSSPALKLLCWFFCWMLLDYTLLLVLRTSAFKDLAVGLMWKSKTKGLPSSSFNLFSHHVKNHTKSFAPAAALVLLPGFAALIVLRNLRCKRDRKFLGSSQSIF